MYLQARQEVGESDQPEFNWIIGKTGSLLDYKMVGVHTCISGTTPS
jgi:dihydrodipicolinate synthase/N-acetylneuraminate lyase